MGQQDNRRGITAIGADAATSPAPGPSQVTQAHRTGLCPVAGHSFGIGTASIQIVPLATEAEADAGRSVGLTARLGRTCHEGRDRVQDRRKVAAHLQEYIVCAYYAHTRKVLMVVRADEVY